MFVEKFSKLILLSFLSFTINLPSQLSDHSSS